MLAHTHRRNRRRSLVKPSIEENILEDTLHTLRHSKSTRTRRTAIDALGATGINVDQVAAKELLSLCRDTPERLSFYMRLGKDVLDDGDGAEGAREGVSVRKLPAEDDLVVDTRV